MKKIALLHFFILVMLTAFAQPKHQFTLAQNDFLLDGKPFQLISGEMHPARIPKEYWRQRIQMAKAMGCNTIAAYIFWNYHEQKEGVFDFTTGNRNIAEFVRICQQEKMWVLFRPGPYVCAEWDFGGLPVWLLKIPDIKIRCMDKRYIAAVTKYINRLSIELKPLLVTNGGPVLMVQVENEYGSYGNDKTYIKTLSKLWRSNGINTAFYTADGATPYMLEAGNVDGAAIGLDSGASDADFAEATKQNPDVPSFSSETYPGWLTHWGEKWARPDTTELKNEIEYLLRNKKSFNLYVVHGGTNFGFTAGANAFSATQYQPDLTSYDYDAPINEQGRATPKFFMLRNLIEQYTDHKLPDMPMPEETIEIPPVTLAAFTTIWKELPAPVHFAQPVPMEMLNQNQGLILYRTKLIGHKSGKLTITEPHDYVLVFLDGKFIDTIKRDGGKWTINIPKTDSKDPVLDILVEGMGHINFAQYMIDRKGITDRVTLNGMTLMDWDIFSLPMDEKFIGSLKPKYPEGFHDGIFFKGEFSLAKTGDTYFDMHNYFKGILYVNGHNLGRYWNIGPQYRLYCPASWLKKGKNEMVVFDLHLDKSATVSSSASME
jgi:beta-galactosidase